MFSKTRAFSGFAVDDIGKTKHFYGQVLGLNVTENAMGILELEIEGGHRIIIYPKPDHIPATYTILNFPVSDIEDAVDALIGKGITFEQYAGAIQTDEKGICRSTQGPLIAWFKDPAGNILSVLEEN